MGIISKPVPKVSNDTATQKLQVVYSDFIGPVSTSGIGGNRYAISFIYEFSGYAVVKFMKCKTQIMQAFKEYVTQYDSPKILRTDNGTGQSTKTKALEVFA